MPKDPSAMLFDIDPTQGKHHKSPFFMGDESECWDCEGTGKKRECEVVDGELNYYTEPCPECNGEGRIK